ncbi:DUF1579 family protein [Pseudoalteromonas rubra]|uniref:DUF1579 domain-containing protein n=1 Tax=Pseudoalteromonas rubra TaxID=43658 RepID=A0A0F4QKN3_9GAMM|nr:DUF1579 family protein [Pseudoalteromonas rubra]KJZ08263.1 hypothetical protein TW77_12650 [Pseudoalteromonas rubra]
MHTLIQLCCGLILFCHVALAAVELPLPQHQVMKLDEGEWSAKLSFFADGQLQSEHQWHESNTMLGDLWSIGSLYGSLNGKLFKGYATLGYDPKQGKFVGTWVDSMSPEILQMHGDFDFKTNTLTMFYQLTDSSGQVQQRKNVMVYKNTSHRDFIMYIQAQDKWVKSMHIDYRRVENHNN